MDIATIAHATKQPRERTLRDRLWNQHHGFFPFRDTNGDTVHRLANSSTSFRRIELETILMALAAERESAPRAAPCMVGSVVASHVLLAMGLPVSLASSAFASR